MICPVDRTVLRLAERQGIEIDFCPACRGVWLDRGELDKIIELSATRQYQPAPAPQATTGFPPPAYGYESQPQHQRRGDDDDDWDADDRYKNQQPGYGQHPQRKKKSFLGDIFDFD